MSYVTGLITRSPKMATRGLGHWAPIFVAGVIEYPEVMTALKKSLQGYHFAASLIRREMFTITHDP